MQTKEERSNGIGMLQKFIKELLEVFWNSAWGGGVIAGFAIPPGESACAHLVFGLMLRFSWV